MNHLVLGPEEGHHTGVSAWSQSRGADDHPHPQPLLLLDLRSRLAQLLPHVAQKNSVLVPQTKGFNFAKPNLTRTGSDASTSEGISSAVSAQKHFKLRFVLTVI